MWQVVLFVVSLFTKCVCSNPQCGNPYCGPLRASLWLSDCAVDPDCYCKNALKTSLYNFFFCKQPSDTTWCSSWKKNSPLSYFVKCAFLVQLTLHVTFFGSHCGLSHVGC